MCIRIIVPGFFQDLIGTFEVYRISFDGNVFLGTFRDFAVFT